MTLLACKRKRLCIQLGAAVAATLLWVYVAAAASMVGTNTSNVAYFVPTNATINAFLQSEPPRGNTYMVWGDLPGMAGEYRFSWEGTSKLQSVSGGTYNPDTGVLTARGGVLKVTFSNADHRRVKLLRPGYTSDAAVFTDEYIRSKAPFGVIRLMDWMKTNHNPVRRFEERAKPDDLLWSTEKGAPLEPYLDHAKVYGQTLWVNVYHQYGEGDIRKLAGLCKDRIGESPVNLATEYSNEVWNQQFSQHKYVWEEAQKPEVRAALRLGEDPRYWIQRYVIYRNWRIGVIFREVFGESDTRVRPLYVTGIGRYAEAEDAVSWLARTYGEAAAKSFYGIGIANYYGSSLPAPAVQATWTANRFADHTLESSNRLGTAASSSTVSVRKFKALASKWRWAGELIAYEAGVDLGQGDAGVKAKAAAQRLANTGKAVAVGIQFWRREAGGWYVYFTDITLHNRSGVWGMMSKAGEWDATKFVNASEQAAAWQSTEAPPTPPPTTQPTPEPEPDPTTSPAPQPGVETVEDAIRNGQVAWEIKPGVITMKVLRPSPIADTVLEIRGNEVKRVR